MRRKYPQIWLFLVVLLSPAHLRAAEESACKTEHWKPAIAKFVAADQQKAPKQQHVLFVGSSSIVGWKLDKFFPDLKPINRGFGGSTICQSTHFAQELVLKHRPKIVVLYAGDNDVAMGNSPKRVYQDFQAFWAKLHKALPETKLVFIAIKPSIMRWKMSAAMHEANELIAADCAKQKLLTYVDIWKPMLGEDGLPRKELFRSDGLHLNDTGYALWTKIVKPHLKQAPAKTNE